MSEAAFRTLLLRKLDVRCGPWKVTRLALHHHHQESRKLRSHSHSHSQLLCYLSGSGRIQIEHRQFTVHTGEVVYIPARTKHSFEREAVRNPLCLVIDFTSSARSVKEPCVAHADAATLAQIRKGLSDLRAIQTTSALKASDPGTGASVLRLFDLLMRTTGLLPAIRRCISSSLLRKVQLVISQETGKSLSAIAVRVGLSKDHLNRTLRRETGLTMGQIRDEYRLKLARRLLFEVRGIGNAAMACGFVDPNYFARWFKKQTGLTPREYVAGFERNQKH